MKLLALTLMTLFCTVFTSVTAQTNTTAAAVAATTAAGTTVSPTIENRVKQLETRNKELLKRLDDLDSAGFVKCCRVCFQQTERSGDQCQGANDTCSEWSCQSYPGWTQPFRDNTDYRPGGCTYKWRVECKDKK